MKRSQQKAMFAKNNRLSRDEWKQIIANNQSIVEEQRKYNKYFKKIDTPSGFAFSDLDHVKRAEAQLDIKLNKLAKKYDYKQDGFSKYQPWLDHSKGN